MNSEDLATQAAEQDRNRELYGTPWAPATPVPRRPKQWPRTPSSARLANWLQGGDDNYQAEREVFAALPPEDVKWAKVAADINLDHNVLAARAIAMQNTDQFLDLGSGFPTMTQWRHQPDVHAAVLEAEPDATVIYVDIDALALGQRRMRTESLGVRFVQGDLREMPTLLASDQISGRLDLTRPVGLLLHDVLPWISDAEATEALRVLRAWAPRGSLLSITHASDMAPSMPSKLTPIVRDVAERFPDADLTYHPRTVDEINAFFGDWTLVAPGRLVPTHHWHRDHPHRSLEPHYAGAYAGIAVKGFDAA